MKVSDVRRALAALSGEQDLFNDGHQMDIEGAICAGSLLAQMKRFVHDHGFLGDRRLVALIDAVIDEPVVNFFKRSYGLVDSDLKAASKFEAAVAQRIEELGYSARIAAE